MINTIRERAIVKSSGTITITSPELVEGTEVEVLVLIENEEMDTTAYLLSNEANRERLLNSIRDAEEHPENLIPFDIEDYEKRLASS